MCRLTSWHWLNERCSLRLWMVFALLNCAVCVAFGAGGISESTIPIDDFEDGVTQWQCRDATHPDGGATLCAIWGIAPGCPEARGERAALITFFAGRDTWASVTRRVDGDTLIAKGAEGIALWVRGDGSATNVIIALVMLERDERVQRFEFKLPLNMRRWQWVAIPFDEFRTVDGESAGSHLSSITAIEFRMVGTWDSSFLLIDDLCAYTGQLGAPREPAPRLKEAPVEEEQVVGAKAVRISVNADEVIGKVVLRVGANLDTTALSIINRSAIRKRIRELRLSMGRIKTSDATAWSEDTTLSVISYDTLEQLIVAVQRLGMTPLVACVPLSPRQFTAEQFIQQCTDIAERYATQQPSPIGALEIMYSPMAHALGMSSERIVERLSEVFETVRKLQLRCAVGGMGVAAPWRTLVLPFINDVQGLDFVSFHFYGTHNASTDTDTLMKAAITGVAVDLPNQLPLNLLHALVRQRWGAHAGVYITEANINSVRNDDGSARDERIAQPQAMAWWLTFLQTASSTVNEIIQYKLCGGGWGLIDDAGMPTPAYWAVWLFNIYAPRDSDICRLVSADGAIKGMAVRTPTALNVLMANVRSEPIRIEVTVEWRSAPHLKMVRLRRILPAGVSVSQPTYEILSRESTQRVLLPGYGIAVLQFVPLGNAG